jgi:O-antigen ligase
MIGRARPAVIPAYVGLCLVLGGSSAAGILANLLLQLVAIPIICWAIAFNKAKQSTSAERQLVGICGLAIVAILIQLVPLPPTLWTAFPGREQIAEGYALLGQPLPWASISLAPHDTLYAGLSLLPPLAVVLGMVRLRAYDASWLIWVIGGIAAGSVFLGTLQLLSGANSGFYPYVDSSYGSPTGFFANSNHLATLLVVAIPLLAALYARGRDRQKQTRSSAGKLAVTLGVLSIIGVGIFVNWSLAGLSLAIPVALASLVFFSAPPRLVLLGALLLALPLALLIFMSPLGAVETSDSLTTSSSDRLIFARTTGEAAAEFAPLGSGGGTFEDIYARYEDPSAVNSFYVNHAHNDYLEVLLEFGLPGAFLIMLFLFWWAKNAQWAISKEGSDYYGFAATLASAAILAHSLVDYPLRTVAISAVLAACCSIIASGRKLQSPN